MKNVKLGDQVYVGVRAVRTDTAEGGTAEFAPYDETFAAGRAEGYNAGKEDGLEEGFDNGKTAGIEEGYIEGKAAGRAEGYTEGKAEGYAEGKEEGIQTEYDRFWDAFQDNGAIRNYRNQFSYYGWNDDTFYPKYNISVSGDGYSGDSMFRYCEVTDMAQRLEELGLVIDTSRCVWLENAFRESFSKRWPALDFSAAATANYCFFWAHAITIDKLTANENCTWLGAFNSATNLANITFEGIIGQDISFQSSPLSVDSMKSVITHLKNYSGTADAGTKTVKFTDACWTALEADGTTAPDGTAWRDYVETTLGWLT